MSAFIKDSPLGQQSNYVSVYAPELLFSIPRSQSRQVLAFEPAVLPFRGGDIWTGYELSWLGAGGKPEVAIAEFFIPCESTNIIESKSFKLYLNSFNQTTITSRDALQQLLMADLSKAADAVVDVRLFSLDEYAQSGIQSLAGELIDDQDIVISTYHPEPALLKTHQNVVVDEILSSHLLKTNCPVTGQPDWASIQIQYSGPAIDRAGLLAYIVSFREHQDFHEHCVERIFTDISARCTPQSLSVYARYTRRGGLDINPFRTTATDNLKPSLRLVRQ